MRNLIPRIVLAAPLLLVAGCLSGPSKQLRQCQEDKEDLLASIREERDANRKLQTQVVSLEARLDQSEKELARLDRPAARLSSRPASAAPSDKPALKTGPLPWRSPADAAPRAAPGKSGAAGSNRTSAASDSRGNSLAVLAQRDKRIAYDAPSGMARLDVEVPFDDGSAQLTAAGRRQLDDVARLLKSDEAADLRVLVSGFAAGRPQNSGEDGKAGFTSARQLGAARAEAVADYLDRHGIAGDRLGVTATGVSTRQLASREPAASSVQIYLADPTTPLTAWGPADAIRR
jgi:outer membrane protein OmpA-like peptidoglycan-associated protein